jgi:hypothetical protein
MKRKPEGKKQHWIGCGRCGSQRGADAWRNVQLEKCAVHGCVEEAKDANEKIGAHNEDHDGSQGLEDPMLPRVNIST